MATNSIPLIEDGHEDVGFGGKDQFVYFSVDGGGRLSINIQTLREVRFDEFQTWCLYEFLSEEARQGRLVKHED